MAAGVIAAAAALGAKQRAQRAATAESLSAFAALATQRKLAFEEVTHPTPLGPLVLPRVSGAVAGMKVVIEIALDSAHLAHTRVVADARAPADVDISLTPTPPGLFGAIRNMFDGKDIKVGDERFDDLFVVHATPSEAALALFDEARRAVFVSWLGHQFEGFRYERGHITLGWEGVERETSTLDSALALLDDIASWHFTPGEAGYRG